MKKYINDIIYMEDIVNVFYTGYNTGIKYI
jgi:hypothetical protein